MIWSQFRDSGAEFHGLHAAEGKAAISLQAHMRTRSDVCQGACDNVHAVMCICFEVDFAIVVAAFVCVCVRNMLFDMQDITCVHARAASKPGAHSHD